MISSRFQVRSNPLQGTQGILQNLELNWKTIYIHGNMRVFSLIATVLALVLFGININGSKYSHEMLLAAEKGETDKVVDLITNRGVFITTKNNYGVR